MNYTIKCNTLQGDVSTINKNNGLVQKEIKHHIAEDDLTDRDVDFWKSLANWHVSYDEIKKFDSLVLYTTSIIPSNGKLEEWNNKTKEEKLAILIEIGAEKKKEKKLSVPNTIEFLMTVIMVISQKVLHLV